jgi:hypothetical protein
MVALADVYQPGVPFGFYRFTFRYSDLPHDKGERIPGGSCDRRISASK